MSNKMTATNFHPTEIQQANKDISDLIETAEAAIKRAEAIATKHGVGFNLTIGGYGMGGWFDSEGWSASSESC